MKTKLMLCVCVSMLGFGASFEIASKEYCSIKTLKGTYTYSSQGYYAGEPYAESGMESYNGAGNVVNNYTDSLGRVSAGDTATYVIGEDCHGTVTYNSGSVYKIYVSPNGDSMTYILTSGDGVIAGTSRRVSSKLILK
ncbi:conserved protein of unknown function [Methylococcus capsulatus]|uniref:Uncharacterized protein n=1 Tax=Methylococcus capsulatus TaxID=414 RepID=A0AA35URS0_METCP|nr:hypothetical protein [Methylococcus capsulatus]CAI8717360.1 conserved protein of unknown function [Methylococcus capsulatus]